MTRTEAVSLVLAALGTDAAAVLISGRRARTDLCRGDDDIDFSGVTFSDPAVLPALRWLIVSAGDEGFRVRGLGWNQFLDLLRRTPLPRLGRTCTEIRSILGATVTETGRP